MLNIVSGSFDVNGSSWKQPSNRQILHKTSNTQNHVAISLNFHQQSPPSKSHRLTTSTFSSYDLELRSMTLTFKFNSVSINVNLHAKYLVQN